MRTITIQLTSGGQSLPAITAELDDQYAAQVIGQMPGPVTNQDGTVECDGEFWLLGLGVRARITIGYPVGRPAPPAQ